MPDLIEEIKQKQRQRTRDTIITFVIVVAGMVALIYFTINSDKEEQKALYTYGGAVGVENQTNHHVTLRLFLHDNTTEPVLSHTIEPRGHWVVRDSMSQRQVSNFPPVNWLDSALIIYDDTIFVWQRKEDPWYVEGTKHYIRESSCWKYESLVVRRASRYHPALYRPLRVYYLTEEDYERATKANTDIKRVY